MDSSKLTLKAALVPLTTLSFDNTDLDGIRTILAQKQADAPALFNNLPCVLDLSGLDAALIPLADLYGLCLECGLLPIAVRNVTADWSPQLAPLRLADLGKGNTRRTIAAPDAEAPAADGSVGDASPGGVSLGAASSGEAPSGDASSGDVSAAETSLGEGAADTPVAVEVQPAAPLMRALKVHTGNIRSGQQMYFDGDLVIQGTVSPGAEVLATGDIHIYGVLRGRVLAGIKGDESAIVGCHHFDGELIAIAGHYRLFDNDHPHQGQSVVIRLDDGSLNISTLS